jgi:hypothetical protein
LFFRLNNSEGFLILFVFLDQTPALESAIHRIREQITRQLGDPVLVVYERRCFDNYAYLGRCSLPDALVPRPYEYPVDVPIPGANYSFAQLQRALCLGVFDSFVNMDRHAIRVNLTGELAAALGNLHHVLEHALPGSL